MDFLSLYFENIGFDLSEHPIRNTILATIGIYITLLYLLGTYKKMIRYSGTKDYISIGVVAIMTALILSFIKPLVVPRTLDVNVIMLACIFTGGLSIVMRVLLRTISYAATVDKIADKKKVLIIGAGQAASQIIKTIQMSAKNEYDIVGIIDDDQNKKNFSMHGIKILGGRDLIPEVCEEEHIDLIL